VGGVNRGRSEMVVLVREVLWVTAVYPASFGRGNGRAPARPTKGAADATAATFLAREGAGGSAGLAQEVGGFAVARLTQAFSARLRKEARSKRNVLTHL